MKGKKIFAIAILTIILMTVPLFLPKVDAVEFNSNFCTYKYKGCTLQLRQNQNINGEGLGWVFWYGNEDPDEWVYCNESDKVKAIGTFGASTGPFLNNFEETKNKIGETECPDIRIRKEPGTCKDGSGMNARTFKCYPLGKRTFEPGKCNSTTNYDCVSYTGYEGDVGVDDLPDPPTTTANIDVLTKLGISDGTWSCEQLLGDEVIDIIDMVFLIIRIATPIILIVLTMVDYSKAIAGGEEELKAATNKFMKRAIAAIAIFLAPTVINFLMDITGISDGSCGLDF